MEIYPLAHYVRFSIKPRGDTPGAIVARTGHGWAGVRLGDLGARKRMTTELTGYVNEDFRGDGGQCGRLISNFAIFPRNGFAVVNVEPWEKIVRITETENAQGTKSALIMPGLYYFFGEPKRIYSSFLEVRNQEGFTFYKPKYEWFGVGWEAFGALAWNTNEKTVTENVERYLEAGLSAELDGGRLRLLATSQHELSRDHELRNVGHEFVSTPEGVHPAFP